MICEYMIYIRICWAAIQRHRIERPIRGMWEDYISRRTLTRKTKLKSKAFTAIVDTLAAKGLIDKKDASFIVKEYARYSDILHGSTPI